MLLRHSFQRCRVETSLPNNRSLTRLVLPLSLSLSPLSESSDVTARTANNTDRPLLAKLWHVGFASILLNYLPAWPGVVLSRSWIDKLPDPVFRRHVTLNVATSNTEEKCYGYAA